MSSKGFLNQNCGAALRIYRRRPIAGYTPQAVACQSA